MKTVEQLLSAYIDENGYSLGKQIRKDIIEYLKGFENDFNEDDIMCEIICEVQTALGN